MNNFFLINTIINFKLYFFILYLCLKYLIKFHDLKFVYYDERLTKIHKFAKSLFIDVFWIEILKFLK